MVQAATRWMQPALLPACLAAIVLGILGMHTFAHHDPVPMPGIGHHQVGSAGDAATGHHLGAVSGATPATPRPGHSTATGADGTVAVAAAPANSNGDMFMLCAVMLLGAAAGLLMVLRLRRIAHAIVLILRPLRGGVRNRVALLPGADPPAVWEFCVVRC